jgi:hypothetical protein
VKSYLILAMLILFHGPLLSLVSQEIPVTTPAGQVNLGFDPSTLGLKPGARGKVSLLVENVQGLYGIEFHLTFDPDILAVIDADPQEDGVQIMPEVWWKDGFVAVNKVDNGSGRIDFAATLLRPALAISGKRRIASITFAARKTGTSKIQVGSAILSTRNAEAIRFLKQDGTIGVNQAGKAPETQTSAARPAPWRLALAGAALLIFFTALGFFIHTLRRKK